MSDTPRQRPVVYVAGHRGLVGSAIVRAIEEEGTRDWIGRTHAELDLTDRAAVFDFIAETRPDAIVIAAAKVGSFPPRYSATATATSLADLTTSASIAVSTLIVSPGLRTTLDGGWLAACAETGMRVAGVTRPDCIASNSR